MNSVDNRFAFPSKGNVKELLVISLPLMLSILSSTIMTFVDRLILAKYDTHAMNAAVVAGYWSSIFQYATMAIASISEVFVGQYNGAQEHKKMGEPVWQMIWYSLLTTLLFIPLGLYGSSFFIPQPEYLADGVPFFKWSMLFGPVYTLNIALSSFFIGRGALKLVTLISILSNILNILLDYLLIFGISETLAPQGTKGAAIATGVAEMFQVLVLFWLFLRPYHRIQHGTGCLKLKPKLFWKSIRVGIPASLASIFELATWTVLVQILTAKSELHITIYSVGESFFGLFAFAFWGLQKGITTLASNYVGAHREDLLNKILFSGLKIILLIMLFLSLPVFFFPEALIKLFLDANSDLETRHLITSTLTWLWVYFMLDTASWLISGILTGMGDTKFVLWMGSFTTWCFYILPIYLSVTYFEGSPVMCWIISAGYGLINTLAFFLRFKSKQTILQPLYA
jgi:MATE family multidrug resistance protein